MRSILSVCLSKMPFPESLTSLLWTLAPTVCVTWPQESLDFHSAFAGRVPPPANQKRESILETLVLRPTLRG